MCSIGFISLWQWKTVKIDIDQRHIWDWWKEKIHQQSEKVGLQLTSKSKAETMEPLLASLLWEPGAQNHLRSQTPLPRGHPCPLQALSMFKSFIKHGETERQKRGLSYKTKSKRKKKTIRTRIRLRKSRVWGVDSGKLEREKRWLYL